MNENLDPHSLLDDVLREAAPGDFRQNLLRRTLSEVRSRKHARGRARNLTLMAIALGLGVALWRLAPPPTRPANLHSATPEVIRSHPLRPGMIVETRPGTAGIIESAAGGVAIVETAPRAEVVREIDDAELLALTGDRPAALVRRSSQQVELVFLNPSDREGIPVE